MLYKLFLIFCFYLPFQVAINPSEGVDLASIRIFVLILALLWLILGLKNGRIFVSPTIQTMLVISFIFLSGLSLFWAENLNWGLRKFLFLLSIFPIYFVIGGIIHEISFNYSVKRETLIEEVLKFVVWGAGLAAIIGIVQFLSQFIIGLDSVSVIWRNYAAPLFLGEAFSKTVAEFSSWAVNVGGKDYLRVFFIFPDPHMFSFYLGMTLPLAIGLYYAKASFIFSGKNNFKNSYFSNSKIYLVLSIIIFLTNLLTFSRGGYMGMFAGLIFIALYFVFGKKVKIKKISIYFLLALVFFAFLAVTPVGKRFYASFNAIEGSNKERFKNWQQGVDMIRNNPWGVGIGNYSYAIEPNAEYRKPIYAHNLYLDIAAETGIINAIIWITLIIVSIKSFIFGNHFFINSLKGIEKKEKILKLSLVVSLFIFSAHSLFDTALYSVHVLPLFLIIIALSAEMYSTTQ